MEKQQVYCRYCGKLIDENAPFCTYCGKEQGGNTKPSSIWNTLYCFFQNIYSKNPTIKFKSNETAGNYIKKWLKRIIVLVVVLIVICLIVLLSFWLYGSHLVSKWTKEDERREAIALNDITRANVIARELFKESAERAHLYKLCWKECDFDHIERGLAILRNAAEKGNADAQFTLGAIYAGCRYDAKEPYFKDENDKYANTMFGGRIDFKRAAYWYTLAANQGHGSALNNLGNAYRKGAGVERNYVKATELIRKAAEQGDPSAQLNYGDMFRDGEVYFRVVTDSIKGKTFLIEVEPYKRISLAKEWWTKALKNGNEKAKERLEQVYE